MEARPYSPLVLRLCIMTLVALEFLQNGMLAFGAEHIIQGLGGTPQAFSLTAAIYASVAILAIVKHRWLAERLGYRTFVLGSLALYIAGALGSGMASDMPLFTAARTLQALGGATFFTAARMQVNLFSGPARLLSLRLFIMGIFTGSVIAPVLAAWLLSIADWRWLFWSMLLPALACIAMSVRTLPRKPVQNGIRGTPHPVGITVLATAIFLLLFMLEQLPYDLTGNPFYLLVLAALGVAGTGAFVVHEWHRPHPLQRYRHFISWRYLIGLSVFFFCYLVAASNGYILPILLSRELGMSMPQIGGWLTVPFLVCMGTLNLAISLAGKFPGARKYLQFSLAMLLCYALGMAGLKNVAPDWQLVLLLTLFGVSSTFGMEAAAQTALKGMNAEVFSDAYQTKNIVREIALACGISLATLFTQNAGYGQELSESNALAAYHGYFVLLGVVAALLLAVLTLEGWARRRRPAKEVQPA